MATFAALVSKVQNKLNLTSTESATRIGEEINDRYKRITSSLGINVVRRGTIGPIAATLGVTTMIFTGCEKIVNVQYRGVTPYRILKEASIEEVRAGQPSSLSLPIFYAIVDYDATTVTIEMDCVPQAAFDLYADGFVNLSTLSGVQVPAFSESFHDLLEHGALADEYTKMDKVAQAREAEAKYERRLSDLRMWIAKSSYSDILQGKTRQALGSASSPGSGGGSSSVNGATSWTQTGLITFSRAGQAPFAVVVGSLVVANLDADLLDGKDWNTAGALPDAGLGLTDVTTNDVTSAKHGFAPKSPADATKFLNGAATPAYALVKDSDLSTTDVTTNNFTTAKHGFTPKGTSDTAKFLRGDGTFEVAFPLSVCDGRLTLTSGTPVTSADVSGVTNVFFCPYKGNRIALYDGTNWKLYTFTERTLALGTLTNDLPYDVFIFDNAGTITLEAVAWTNKTTRATALVSQDGVLSKTGSLTKRYLGTFHTTSTTTTEDSQTKRLLWNYYNRVRRSVRVKESADSWTYTTATFRQANANTANQVAVVVGVVESTLNLLLFGQFANTNTLAAAIVAIGEDSTTTKHTDCLTSYAQCGLANQHQPTSAMLNTIVPVGYHFYAWLELSAAVGTATWYGDNGVTIQQTGLTGSIEG